VSLVFSNKRKFYVVDIFVNTNALNQTLLTFFFMSLECVQVSSGPFTFSFPTGNFGGAGGQRENDIDAKGRHV